MAKNIQDARVLFQDVLEEKRSVSNVWEGTIASFGGSVSVPGMPGRQPAYVELGVGRSVP